MGVQYRGAMSSVAGGGRVSTKAAGRSVFGSKLGEQGERSERCETFVSLAVANSDNEILTVLAVPPIVDALTRKNLCAKGPERTGDSVLRVGDIAYAERRLAFCEAFVDVFPNYALDVANLSAERLNCVQLALVLRPVRKPLAIGIARCCEIHPVAGDDAHAGEDVEIQEGYIYRNICFFRGHRCCSRVGA